MNKEVFGFLTFVLIVTFGCSVSYKIKRGKVVPSDFETKVKIATAKGVVLVPCEYEGVVKNYYFDTGARLVDIQRENLKGQRIEIRGASNRVIESGTEMLDNFRIGDVSFKNIFATNSDAIGLKEQIPNFGGIIGRSIIDRANWLIDLSTKTITLSSGDLTDDSYTDIILKDSTNGAPYTMISIDGRNYQAIIDLGSTAMINVPIDTELAHYLLTNYSFKKETRERYTVGGLEYITQKIGHIPLLKIGDIEFNKVLVTINQSSQLRIGINLFKNKTIYIDNIDRRYQIK